MNELEIKIITGLKTGAMTLGDIVGHLGAGKSTIHYALKRLVAEGVVVENKLSPKKISYELSSSVALEEYIAETARGLSDLLLKKKTVQRRTVVFTDSFHLLPEHKRKLENIYDIVEFERSPVRLTDELFELRSRGAHVVVRNDMPKVDEVYLSNNPQLECIINPVIRPQNVDLEACARHKVKFINFSNRNADYCKRAQIEYVVSAFMALYRPLGFASNAVKSGKFDYRDHVGREIKGTKVALIGTYAAFEIGSVLRILGCDVMVVDQNKTGIDPVDCGVSEFSALEEVIQGVDVLIAADSHSYKDFDLGDILARSEKVPEYLILPNESVQYSTSGMRELILSKKIKGLVIDAYPEMYSTGTVRQNPRDFLREIIDFPNVITTPGIWGYTENTYRNSSKYVYEILNNLEL